MIAARHHKLLVMKNCPWQSAELSRTVHTHMGAGDAVCMSIINASNWQPITSGQLVVVVVVVVVVVLVGTRCVFPLHFTIFFPF